jgi:hypothetical protein
MMNRPPAPDPLLNYYGEIMVLAHASVFAQRGIDVFVLMDETDGRRRAAREVQWLRSQGAAGALALWSTRQVLQEAGRQTGWIKGDKTWEQVYDGMREFDDGATASVEVAALLTPGTARAVL